MGQGIRFKATLILLAFYASLCAGGELTTEHGFVIPGTPLKISSLIDVSRGQVDEFTYTPYWMVDDGMRRYFLSTKRVPKENINLEAELDRYERFELKHLWGPKPRAISSLGSFRVLHELDEFGRMTVEINTPKGPLPIVLAISEITPSIVRFAAIKDYQWEFARDTTSFSHEVLDPIVKRAIDPESRIDRMAIARFYMQTRQFHHAQDELIAIKKKFPDLKKQLTELETELNTVQANQLLRDLRARQQSGQHRLAVLAAQQFPTIGVKPEVLVQIREIQDEERALSRKIKDAKLLLGNLQSQLEDDDLKHAVEIPRAEISTALDKESIGRLQPFLDLHDDDTLSAEEKLALAISGWILGDQNARTDFKVTMGLWQVRHLVLDYLRNNNPIRDDDLMENILKSEGVAPSTIDPLLKLLPPIIETPGISPGHPVAQFGELKAPEDGPLGEYSVMLPIEYSPHHAYPLIVELRPGEKSRDEMLRWWGEQAARRGYIVVCPEYFTGETAEYDYSVETHLRIERVLRDVMKRFHIDSERIFLAGHGAGGDGAFDFGMAHSDLFAGVIPISGRCHHHCRWTYENDPNLSIYAISGELDRNLLDQNNDYFGKMIRYGGDGLYVEYKGRGYERFYEEIHRLFDWMELHRLERNVREIDFKILRPTDNRLYWLELSSLPESIYTNNPLDPETTTRTVSVEGKLTEVDGDQRIYLRSPRSKLTLWLSPDFFDFDKTLTIKNKSGPRREFIKPDVRTMLEDFRKRADRKNIAWAKVVLD